MVLFRKSRQKGATLLEVVAYLGVASLILVGAVAMNESATGSADAQQIMSEVAGLRSAVTHLYAGQAGAYGYSSISETLIASGSYPATMRTYNNNLISKYGNVVTVTGAGNVFLIQYYGLPNHICTKAASLTPRAYRLAINYYYVATPTSAADSAGRCTWTGMNTLQWQPSLW